jgi:Two component regulator propeller
MHFRFIFLIVILFFSFSNSFSQQLPTGQWRYHYCFSKTSICEAGDKFIYASSGRGFFKVNKQTYEMNRLSSLDGFHGSEITNLTYNPSNDILIIGYSDGFIDLLKDEKIISGIDGFFNKSLQGDKSIIHCTFIDNDALISTNFGILVLDLEKTEIRDSYTSIGIGGQPLEVKSTAVLGDSIYAGINNGIIAAKYSASVNLNNYTNWKKVYNGAVCNQLTSFSDSIYFYTDTILYNYNKGMIKKAFAAGKSNFIRIQKSTDGKIIFFRQGGITKMSNLGAYSFSNVNIISSGSQDNLGRIWFTTGIGGGVILQTNTGELGFEPNGPSNTSLFSMSKDGEHMFCSAGGITSTFGNAYNPNGFYIYHNFNWENNPQSVFNTNLYDYTFLHYNKVTNKTYLGTHTNGMLEFAGRTATNKFDHTNSTLFKDPGHGFIRISGIASDDKGNLWVSNYGAPNPLSVMTAKGVWTAIPIADNNIKSLVIDENGYKWMIIIGGGVAVFDDNKTPSKTSDDRYIRLNTSHGLITNEVVSLAADRNGYVWIGTAQGLNVVTNTFDVFNKPKADRFIIEQNGTTGFLLGEETINDICVDGGNRKWFATNNGVFLAEPDGQVVVNQYTTTNSPLPDNKVICIGQVGSTGEVFFGTDNGIISYRSDASNGDNKFKEIKVYPNPVKPGYTGNVTIEGLAQDAEIRITDAAGMLIYQTKANGGTATWPCTRLDGTKPNSGVLYIFGMNTDGSETAMGKFIFVR